MYTGTEAGCVAGALHVNSSISDDKKTIQVAN